MENADADLVERMAELFRALGDPTRLRLLGQVAERARTGTDLAQSVSVGAPTVSHHMERLIRSGLVKVRRSGQSRVYSLDLTTLQALGQLTRIPITASAPEKSSGEADVEERERAKVIRDFFDGDQLKQIPSQR